jgi:hypothetical protein
MSVAYQSIQKGKIEVFIKGASEAILLVFSFSAEEKDRPR